MKYRLYTKLIWENTLTDWVWFNFLCDAGVLKGKMELCVELWCWWLPGWVDDGFPPRGFWPRGFWRRHTLQWPAQHMIVFFDGKGKSSKRRRLHVLDGAMKFLKSMWVVLRQNQHIKPCPNGTSHLTNNSGKCWSISDASCCSMMQRDASQAAKGKITGFVFLYQYNQTGDWLELTRKKRRIMMHHL